MAHQNSQTIASGWGRCQPTAVKNTHEPAGTLPAATVSNINGKTIVSSALRLNFNTGGSWAASDESGEALPDLSDWNVTPAVIKSAKKITAKDQTRTVQSPIGSKYASDGRSSKDPSDAMLHDFMSELEVKCPTKAVEQLDIKGCADCKKPKKAQRSVSRPTKQKFLIPSVTSQTPSRIPSRKSSLGNELIPCLETTKRSKDFTPSNPLSSSSKIPPEPAAIHIEPPKPVKKPRDLFARLTGMRKDRTSAG